MTDINQESYNKYLSIPQISYNITSYLIDNDDLIWRLLKYNSANAWDVNQCANLSKSQKGALIWQGEGNEVDYRVFFDVGQEYSWKIQATILRIHPIELIASNYVYGNTAIAFDVYSHDMLSTLTNYATRKLSIIQRLIEILNGADIEGVGRLYFDARASSRCRISSIGQVPYRGLSLVLCNKILG